MILELNNHSQFLNEADKIVTQFVNSTPQVTLEDIVYINSSFSYMDLVCSVNKSGEACKTMKYFVNNFGNLGLNYN